jgi:hypothetical protein
MRQMSKVELYAAIRCDHRAAMKLRELERKYNVSWRTVQEGRGLGLAGAEEEAAATADCAGSVQAGDRRDAAEDLDAPRKHRHTITRIFHRLIEEHGADVSPESFGGWTKTFTDPRLCAAIVDRLTFNGTIIETGTDSYRLASTRARVEEPAAAS